MKLEPLYGLDGPDSSQSVAKRMLVKAKRLHNEKCCALKIDERTTIMVSLENCNREYAKAYQERMNTILQLNDSEKTVCCNLFDRIFSNSNDE